MTGGTLAGLVLAGLLAPMLHVVVKPARAIWRGEDSRVPRIPRMQPSARTYLPYLLWFVPLASGTALAGLGLVALELAGDRPIILVLMVPAIGLLVVSFPLMPLHLFATCFNRPRFLIPPSHRDEPGWLTRSRRRPDPARRPPATKQGIRRPLEKP